mmetsp:Transcript_71034/g.205950  ORF Transcript_71034/g.205950 Transcript_71034/m.205950 type:complete len:379 (-) Transcript_71034:123-1259(-)
MRFINDSETDDYTVSGISASSGTDDIADVGAGHAAATRRSQLDTAVAAAGAELAAGGRRAEGGVAGRRGSTEAGRGQLSGEDEDFLEYAESLGANASDTELAWLVREAFEAPRPPSWSEHVDAEGRLYFFNQVTEESTWSHPMDAVYRELVGLIHKVKPLTTLDERAHAVRAHLKEVHGRALAQLEGWSGPYNSDTGQYYHNERLGASTWISPIDEWEYELAVRHSVLHRSLLAGFHWPEEPPTMDGDRPADLLTVPLLQLPLGLARREDDEKSSARSFFTARESARSGSSTVRSELPPKSRGGGDGSRGQPSGARKPGPTSTCVPAHSSAPPAPREAWGAQPPPAAPTADDADGDAELEVTFGASSSIQMPRIGGGG